MVNRLSEKHLEELVVAALADSPMYRERQRSEFDPQTLLDAEELSEFV